MKVFVFDLLAYGEQLDHLKVGNELPYPLSSRHFRPDVAVRTYAEHLDAWEEIDRLGYDGLGFNEHHCSPYGLMNSPNLMAASAAQRTKRVKLLIYGNLLPLHEPLRLAEELAMLDCLSDGRLISGFRPRHSARIPGAQCGVVGIARAVRGSLRHRHPRLDRGCILLSGEILVVSRRRAVAAPGAAAASGDLGAGGRQQGIDRVRRAATTSASRPAWRPAACRTTSSATTRNAWRRMAMHHAGPSVARAVGLCRRQQGAGGEGVRPVPAVFQPHPVQPRQLHRDQHAAPVRL